MTITDLFNMAWDMNITQYDIKIEDHVTGISWPLEERDIVKCDEKKEVYIQV